MKNLETTKLHVNTVQTSQHGVKKRISLLCLLESPWIFFRLSYNVHDALHSISKRTGIMYRDGPQRVQTTQNCSEVIKPASKNTVIRTPMLQPLMLNLSCQ